MPLRPATAAVLCLAFIGATPAHADAPREGVGVWLASGFLSKHDSDRDAPAGGWNETNGGIGVEVALNANWRIAGGVYDNSMRMTSRYLQAVWTPDRTTWQVGPTRLTLGAAAGVVDGYPMMKGGGYFPTLLPVASIEYRRVGVNLTYIPSIAGNVSGAFALQAKFRFF